MENLKSEVEVADKLDYKLTRDSQNFNLVPNLKPVPKPPSDRYRRLRRFGRVLVDFGLANLAFFLACYMRYQLNWGGDEQAIADYADYMPAQLAFAFGLVLILQVRGYYSSRRITGLVDEFTTIFKAVLLMVAALVVLLFLSRQLFFSRVVFVYLIPVTLLLMGLERYLVRRVYRYLWERGIGTRKLLVIGATDPARRVMDSIVERPNLGYHLIGYVDNMLRFSRWIMPVKYRHGSMAGREVPLLGTIDHLEKIIDTNGVEEVIIALPATEHEVVNQVIEHCRERKLAYTLVPDVFALPIGTLDVQQLNGVPLISLNENKLTGWNYVLKRSFDIVLALVGLTVASPVMLLTALAIKRDSPGPVFFKQSRVGKNGKLFECYKFRSMYIDAEKQLEKLQHLNETGGITFKMKDDPRRTRVGKFIRKTSLDELPQLFNILLGQMSFIGPRPATEKEVARYDTWHRRRLEVTPGLSGLWQVSGRSRLSFEDMVKLDIYYAEHWSIWLDFKIMLRTPMVVLKGDGAS